MSESRKNNSPTKTNETKRLRQGDTFESSSSECAGKSDNGLREPSLKDQEIIAKVLGMPAFASMFLV